MADENNEQPQGTSAPQADGNTPVDSADWSDDDVSAQMLKKVNGLLQTGQIPPAANPEELPPAEPEPEVTDELPAADAAPATPEATEEPAAEELPEDPEDEPEPDAHDHALPPAVQARIDKRIGKEVTKRKTAEEAAQALESQVTELTAQLEQAQTAAPAAPSGRVSAALLARDENELNEHAQNQHKLKQWCLENWDGFDSEDETQQPSVSADKVRRIFAQVDQELSVDLPQARQRLGQRQSLEPLVQNAYPEAKSPNSQFNQVYTNLVNSVPEVLSLPQLKLVVGDSLVGAQLRALVQDQPVGPLLEEFRQWRAGAVKEPKTPVKRAPQLPTRGKRSGKSPLASPPPPKPRAAGTPDFSQVNFNDREAVVGAIAQSLKS